MQHLSQIRNPEVDVQVGPQLALTVRILHHLLLLNTTIDSVRNKLL
jgi:hypothetical protein